MNSLFERRWLLLLVNKVRVTIAFYLYYVRTYVRACVNPCVFSEIHSFHGATTLEEVIVTAPAIAGVAAVLVIHARQTRKGETLIKT